MARVWILFTAFVALMLFMAPVLAKQAGDDDQYQLKNEWKGKPMIVEKHGDLTLVVFQTLHTAGAGQAYEWDGMKWYSTPVKYTINPSAAVKKYRLSSSDVVSNVTQAFEAWDSQVDRELFSIPSVSNSAKANTGRPDGKNVVTWGSVSDRNVIAVTWIWYYTATGQIIDTDMIFNTYYKWGIDTDGEGPNPMPASTFDIRNIGTHEAGHVCGLGDIYDPAYSAMTMYGYGSYGEVKKISLEPGDITGIRALY